MLQRLAILALLLAATAYGAKAVLDLIFRPAGPANASGVSREDEGWRRTNLGWQWMTPRVVSVAALGTSAGNHASTPHRPGHEAQVRRWDFHPAALALMQLLGAVAAFSLFPNEVSAAARRESQTLF